MLEGSKNQERLPWGDSLRAEIEVVGEHVRALREKFNETYGEEKESSAMAGEKSSPWHVEKGDAVELEEQRDIVLRAMQGAIFKVARQVGIPCVIGREGDAIRVSPKQVGHFEDVHALVKILTQEAAPVLKEDGLSFRFSISHERGDTIISVDHS